MQQELVQGALVQLAPQWQPAPLPMFLIWHARYQKDPAHRWLREQIEASVGADERIEAEARAKVWEDRYPVGKVKAAGD